MRPNHAVVVSLTAVLCSCAAVERPEVERTERARPTLTASMPLDQPVSDVEHTALGGARQGGESGFSLPVGVGFMASPSLMMLGAGFDVPFDDDFAAGLSMQVGIGEEGLLWVPTAQMKYFLPGVLEDSDVDPYLTGGIGFAHLRVRGGDNDTSVVFDAGAGLRVRGDDGVSIGTEARINFAGAKLEEERYWFSWEVIQVVFDF